MIFYNSTTNQGICQEIDRLCDTTDTSYSRQGKTSRVNNSLELVVGWIINADGTWQFDDTNYTTHPRGTGTLVEGQQDYSFSSEYLQIEAIDILQDGNPDIWVKIKQIDHSEMNGMSPDQYFGVGSDGNPAKGFPTHYDINGDTIRLYPAPAAASNVVLADGLRVWFKRTASLFTVASDTSTDSVEPGFASPYHIILAYMASVPHCMSYKKDRVALYEKKVMDFKKEIIKHYSHKNQDKRPVMSNKEISYI